MLNAKVRINIVVRYFIQQSQSNKEIEEKKVLWCISITLLPILLAEKPHTSTLTYSEPKFTQYWDANQCCIRHVTRIQPQK